MAADDLTEFHFFQQKNKKLWLQWLKERKHWTIGKTLPGLMNPGSCFSR
jgi:hypothetical protein